MSDAPLPGGHPAGTSTPVDVPGEPLDITPGPDSRSDDRSDDRRPRRRQLVLAAILLVGLAGAAGLGSVGWQVITQKDAVLATPATVSGLTRDESESAASTADYLRDSLAAKVNVDNSIGVVYQDPAAANRSVLLAGATALLWRPDRDLDAAFGLLADQAGAVTDLHEVPAGPLGGVMKCGSTKSDDGDLAVCGWADHGSVGLGIFPGRSTTESAALFRTLRSAVQSRN